MEDAGHGQLIKAGLLLAAGVGFAVWQWRDLDRARRLTAQQREHERARDEEARKAAPSSEPGPGEEPR